MKTNVYNRMMETPDFLVEDDVYERSVFSNDEEQISTRNPRQASSGTRDDFAEYSNSIFGAGRLNIKVEQSLECTDNGVDATDDENVAVEALRSLSSSHAKQDLVCCPHCSTLKTSRDELGEHIAVCQNQQQSQSRTALKAQKSSHHCPICKESFERLNELNNHLVCHASSRPHACRVCGSLFIQKQDLQNHLVTHGITQSHQCKTCGQQFTRMSALSNHMKIHTYTAGRALIDKIGDTNELEDILTGNADPELQAVSQMRQKLILPSINQISMSSNAAWAMNYESDAYNGMNLSDINPNIPNLNDNHKSDNLSSNPSTSTVICEAVPTIDREVDPKRPYRCEKCDKSFAREKAYINHINNVNNHSMCERCDQHFSSLRALEYHKKYCGNNEVKQPRTTKPNLCEESDEMTREKFEKRYKHVCDICEKRFSTKQKLFRHVWIHRKKLHICEVCSESFSDQSLLDSHRKEKHPSGGPYECEQCGKNFCSRQGLWEHGRTHTKDITYYRCDVCEKTFTSRQGFLIHKRTHSDERPYGCKYCMKSFRDGGTLRKHERIHTGERPHGCPICNKTFNQKVVLREHVRWLHANTATENQDGLYACALCAAAFAEKDELSAHYMKHSDQLAQIAKEASKNNISNARQNSQITLSSLTSTSKRAKMETDVMVSCDVEINEGEMAIPLVSNFNNAGNVINNSGNGENGADKLIDSTYFEMTRVSQHDGDASDYKPKIKVRELMRTPAPEVKLEFEHNQVDFECEMCNSTFDNQEDLTRHVSVHM